MLNSRIYLGVIGVLLLAILVLVFLPEKSVPPTEPTPSLQESVEPEYSTKTVIGSSVEGRDIEAFRFGTGETNLLFVGGIHGGYEWNSILLAEEMIAAFETRTLAIPETVTVHVIPNLNPDGYAKHLDPVTNFTDAEKRFNANGVDLNRNFDCRWAPESSWRSQTVSAGDAPFSEPEAAALRDYVLNISPAAAIFWHSKANNVYGSECGGGVSDATLTLASTYATAGAYGLVPVFDAYVVTGAAEDWLASLGIPAITVELETRDSSEYQRNRAGTTAILNLYK